MGQGHWRRDRGLRKGWGIKRWHRVVRDGKGIRKIWGIRDETGALKEGQGGSEKDGEPEMEQEHQRRNGGSEGGLRPWERSQGTPGSPPPLTLFFLRALASATFLMGRALISFQRCR